MGWYGAFFVAKGRGVEGGVKGKGRGEMGDGRDGEEGDVEEVVVLSSSGLESGTCCWGIDSRGVRGWARG